jgi:hypothetical protein
MTDIRTDQMEAVAEMSATWTEQGLVVTGDPTVRAEVRRGDDLIGWVEPAAEHPGLLVFQAAIATWDNGEPRGVPFPAGFLPPRPEQARDSERRRWLPAGS